MPSLKSLLLFMCCAFGLSLTVAQVTAQAEETTAEKLASIGGYPCPASDFTCLKLTVPLDHFTAGDKRTIDVVFGVLPATGERKGMFITATGGPGSSGLESADYYVPDFDAQIKEHYDLVFFDQRGAKQSGNLQCPNALTGYGFGGGNGEIDMMATASTNQPKGFVDACVAEIAERGVPADTLKFYGTTQAVEDLEAFRVMMGDDKIWLYGESYGTDYAQRYATAHPDHVAALFLDGTLDLTTSLLDLQQEQVYAFNDVLLATLQDCDRNAACNADVGGDTVGLYDSLTVELGRSSIDFQFPIASGRLENRTFTLDMLESAAADTMYSTQGRMLFQRALAAVAQNNFVPLARLYYATIGTTSESRLTSYGDPSDDTLFFVITCADNRIAEGSSDAQLTAYDQAGTLIEAANLRLSIGFYGRLPCAYWPGNPPSELPQPLVAEGIPTFVLGATTDPATPVQNGERVYSRLENGYLITAQGGSHVIFNRGNSCPNNLIKDFLVEDVLPAEREIQCEDVVADPYVPLSPTSVRVFDTPLQIMDAVYNEIAYLPEYYFWNTNQLVMTSCSLSGVMSFASDGGIGDQFRLSDCSFFNGFTMTGTGAYRDGVFSLDVFINGFESGTLHYVQDAYGNISVTGEYGGKLVDLSDTRTDAAA